MNTLKGLVDQLNKPATREACIDKPYIFDETPDEVGVLRESAGYADRTCNTCYGRGWVKYVIVDNTHGKVFDDSKERIVKNPHRQLMACHCIKKMYTRYHNVMAHMMEMMKQSGPTPDTVNESLTETV